MKGVIKFLICAVILVAGWVSYWWNRPPHGAELQMVGIMVGFIAVMGRGFLWAISELIDDED